MSKGKFLQILDKIKAVDICADNALFNAAAFGGRMCITLRTVTQAQVKRDIALLSPTVQKTRAAAVKKMLLHSRIFPKVATMSNAEAIAAAFQWAAEQVVERDVRIKEQLPKTLVKITERTWLTDTKISSAKKEEETSNTLDEVNDKDDRDCVFTVLAEDWAMVTPECADAVYKKMCEHWWLSRHTKMSDVDGQVHIKAIAPFNGKPAGHVFVKDTVADGKRFALSVICAAIKKRLQNKDHARKSRTLQDKRKRDSQAKIASERAQKRACVSLERSSIKEYHCAVAPATQAFLDTLFATWAKG